MKFRYTLQWFFLTNSVLQVLKTRKQCTVINSAMVVSYLI